MALTYGARDWEWDGVNWTACNVAPAPKAGPNGNDPLRGRLMRLQGNDTFEWDGRNWFLSTAPGPSERDGSPLACDLSSQQMLLFGGTSFSQATSTFQTLGDTWLWNGTAWTHVIATRCCCTLVRA